MQDALAAAKQRMIDRFFQKRPPEKAFAALQSLDATMSEKAELAAAGVGSKRIDVLYPDSEFALIVAGLIERLPQIPGSKLSPMTADICYPALNGLRNALPQAIRDQINAGREVGISPDDDARLNLGIRIDERSGMLPPASEDSREDRMPTYGTVTLTDSCWWAWWSMKHRDEIPEAAQLKADALMLVVAQIFRLNS